MPTAATDIFAIMLRSIGRAWDNHAVTITEIAGYRVIRLLGAGGMGQVYLVRHPRLPREDALKLLDPAVSSTGDFRARFVREADVLATLSHPNIVTLYDRGEFDGRLWITMEYIAGTDAAELIKTGPLSPQLAIALVGSAGAALDYAWRKQKITHRDVKPANILVGLDSPSTGSGPQSIESVKLADFGIAKAAGAVTSLTSTGITVGTMQYISPEAIDGADLDNRADIYSLGCTAFHLLSGQPPYVATSMSGLMSAHLTHTPPPISERANLPTSVDPVFFRVLAKDPRDRYPTCGAFVEALDAAMRAHLTGAAHMLTEPAPTGPSPAIAAWQTPTTARRAPAEPTQRNARRSWATIVLAGVIAALIVGIGALGYLLIRDRTASTTTAATSSPASIAAAPEQTPSLTSPLTSMPSSPPTTTATTSTPASYSIAKLVGKWGQHSILLTLSSDGSATYIVSQGASNSQTWSATWTATSTTTATVTLVGQLSYDGTLDGQSLYSGEVFNFALTSGGYATINSGSGDVTLCPRDDPSFRDSASECGA
ncbi:serine/threonine-protein kinase [Gordonia asplenii]|uniref:serine/threonine-protein kinase n=1 Tax=Gordonia asplenii TaxID=2725283 RepID=UPI0028AAC1DC|nr:serine/threonine-protein kinase [Gordonia asplenii]